MTPADREELARALCLEIGRCGDTEAIEITRANADWREYLGIADAILAFECGAAVRAESERPKWTCFHCGETFTTPGHARDHFGFDPSADPACRIKLGAERGLVMALRDAEAECARLMHLLQDECSDAAKAYRSQQGRHHRQIMAAEEAGYERGLYDARALPPAPEASDER